MEARVALPAAEAEAVGLLAAVAGAAPLEAAQAVRPEVAAVAEEEAQVSAAAAQASVVVGWASSRGARKRAQTACRKCSSAHPLSAYCVGPSRPSRRSPLAPSMA